MRIDDAEPGMLLAQDVFDEYGNLLLQKGIALTDSYLNHLKRLGITDVHLFDPYAASLKERHVISDELRTELSLCFHAIFTMKADQLLNQKRLQLYLKQLHNTADNIIREISPRMMEVINIQIRKPSEDDINHAINVSLLSVIMGLYLKLPHSSLHDLLLGSLLHDLGKSLVPYVDSVPVIDITMHPTLGKELLLKGQVNSIVARIVGEHHEAFDGSGYPEGLAGKDIHPLSRIVSVANFFDMAINKADKEGTPRHEVVEEMFAAGNTLFDLNILRAFFHTVPVYPVGSLLRLNTDQTAYVIKNRVHFPMRPLVRIADGGFKTDLDLAFNPSITITELIAD